MLQRSLTHRRDAAALADAGLVLPVVMLLTIGVVILALGIYDYLQVVELAREGARWASVHGGQYNSETGNAMATGPSVLNTAMVSTLGPVAREAVGLDTALLTVTLSWADPGQTGMPTYILTSTTNGLPPGSVVPNTVTVTVSYTWNPPLYFSSLTFSSTSTMIVEY